MALDFVDRHRLDQRRREACKKAALRGEAT
jgi:hypothetical protein